MSAEKPYASDEYIDLPIRDPQLASDLTREIYSQPDRRPIRQLAFVEDETSERFDLGYFRVTSVWTVNTPGGYPQVMARMQRML